MERLALAGVLGFVLGICAFVLVLPSWTLGALCVLLAGACAVLALRTPQHLIVLMGAVALLGGALAVGRLMLMPSALPPSLEVQVGETIERTARVVADPDVRETSQRLTVEVEGGARLLVVTDRYPSFSYGEVVIVSGVLMRPEPFETGTDRVFRYDQFLAKDSIFGILRYARVEKHHPPQGIDAALAALYSVKHVSSEALGRALPEPHASLASGLILGGKQGLGEELLNDFIIAGLVHIVVLSGYNIMLVADFVMRIARVCAARAASITGALAIALFVLAAGAGPASIRAGLMALIAVYARSTGRTYDAFRALVLVGVLMLLANPLTLLYDPGFQLSFLATLGLIFGAPRIEQMLVQIRPAFLRELAASTIAAQVAVLPLLLYQNGLLSLVALPVNLLVLPLVPLAMLCSFVALLAGAFIPIAAPLIGAPAYVLLSAITGIASWSAALPLAAVTLPAFPFALVVVGYALLAYALTRLPVPKNASQPHSS